MGRKQRTGRNGPFSQWKKGSNGEPRSHLGQAAVYLLQTQLGLSRKVAPFGNGTKLLRKVKTQAISIRVLRPCRKPPWPSLQHPFPKVLKLRHGKAASGIHKSPQRWGESQAVLKWLPFTSGYHTMSGKMLLS